MASQTQTNLLSFFGGMLTQEVMSNPSSFKGGLVTVGKGITAFVNSLGHLYEAGKDSLGNIKIGNPLKDLDGGWLGLKVKGLGKGVGHAAGSVVSFANEVWNDVVDGYGDPVDAKPITPGSADDKGNFHQSRIVSDKDIQKINDIFESATTTLSDEAKRLYTAGEIPTNEIPSMPSEMLSSSISTTRNAPKTIDKDKMPLYIMIGGIGAIIVVLFMTQRGNK